MGELADPSSWIDLIDAQAVPPGMAATVVVAGQPYAVCNDDGKFAVVDNTCPHAGGSLGEGIVRAGRVICPWHFYEWDLVTGETVDPWPTKLHIYPCRVENGRVQAQLESAGQGEQVSQARRDLHA